MGGEFPPPGGGRLPEIGLSQGRCERPTRPPRWDCKNQDWLLTRQLWDHKAPNIYLIGLGAGPKNFQTIETQKDSDKPIQEIIAIKNYKSHMPTDIYLIGLSVGPSYSEIIEAQKYLSPNPSGNDSYQKLYGPYANRHLSYWVGCWARLF
jgi:hypothetical protein